MVGSVGFRALTLLVTERNAVPVIIPNNSFMEPTKEDGHVNPGWPATLSYLSFS